MATTKGRSRRALGPVIRVTGSNQSPRRVQPIRYKTDLYKRVGSRDSNTYTLTVDNCSNGRRRSNSGAEIGGWQRIDPSEHKRKDRDKKQQERE